MQSTLDHILALAERLTTLSEQYLPIYLDLRKNELTYNQKVNERLTAGLVQAKESHSLAREKHLYAVEQGKSSK